MRISIASDLHLEFADITLPGGDLLILAGDIWCAAHMPKNKTDATSRKCRSRYQRFANDELKKYKEVIVIAGNHEYYMSSLSEAPVIIEDFLTVEAPNAVFLDNDAHSVDGLMILGTTLWSPCGDANPVIEDEIGRQMNDFRLINIRPGGDVFKPSDAAFLYRRNRSWLERKLRDAKGPVIVVTHHAPTPLAQKDTDYRGGPLEEAYCGNCHDLIEDNPEISAWIYGHTHIQKMISIGETWVLSNPRGYFPQEKMSKYFDVSMMDFEVDGFGEVGFVAEEG